MNDKRDKADRRIATLRRRIDRLDDRLLRLLNQRSQLAREIGGLKRRHSSALYVPGREQEILSRLTQINEGPLTKESLEAIYREIMSAALSLEGPLRIGVAEKRPGAAAAAARNHFGASARYARIANSSSAVEQLASGRLHALCLPAQSLRSASRAIQKGLVRVVGRAARGVLVLVRGNA